MARTMVPPPAALPVVPSSERIGPSGRPTPAVRAGLRDVRTGPGVATVAWCSAQAGGVLAVAIAFPHPLVLLAAFLLGGRSHAQLAILGHEAAHRLLLPSKRANDLAGRWLLSGPGLVPFDLYRRAHLAHHRDPLGPDEPDLGLYAGYPLPRASVLRKLRRDALGESGWKNLRPLLRAIGRREGRRHVIPILAAQAVIAGACALAGGWWAWPLLWLGPWLTVWRVLNRLRAIAEHGGMERSDDPRRSTHVVRQRPLARFWFVPYNTGYHLAHHVDMGIPWRRLPALHRELVAAGWVVPELEHPSYLALWRSLASG